MNNGPKSNYSNNRYVQNTRRSKNIEEIFTEIDQLNGIEFEKTIVELLKSLDYKEVIITRGSSDYGVDIIAVKESVKYAFQCKRFKSTVGIGAIQEIVAGKDYYDCSKMVVVTNNLFTRNAVNLATKNKVELWDRNMLRNMLQKSVDFESNEYNLNTSNLSKQKIPLYKDINFKEIANSQISNQTNNEALKSGNYVRGIDKRYDKLILEKDTIKDSSDRKSLFNYGDKINHAMYGRGRIVSINSSSVLVFFPVVNYTKKFSLIEFENSTLVSLIKSN